VVADDRGDPGVTGTAPRRRLVKNCRGSMTCILETSWSHLAKNQMCLDWVTGDIS